MVSSNYLQYMYHSTDKSKSFSCKQCLLIVKAYIWKSGALLGQRKMCLCLYLDLFGRALLIVTWVSFIQWSSYQKSNITLPKRRKELSNTYTQPFVRLREIISSATEEECNFSALRIHISNYNFRPTCRTCTLLAARATTATQSDYTAPPTCIKCISTWKS